MKLTNLIEKRIKSPKIIVLGDLILDKYFWGDSSRISPEAPVPIVKINTENSSLGGSGNVIRNLLSLGAKVELLSVLSDCEASEEIFKSLSKYKINIKNIVLEKKRITSKKNRIFSSNFQVMRFDNEDTSDIKNATEKKLIRNFKKLVKDCDGVILSDYGKGVLTKELTKEIIKISNNFSKKVFIDPKGKDFSKYKGCFLMTPNKKEIYEAFNLQNEENINLEDILKKMKRSFHIKIPLITLGSEGIGFYENNLKIFPTAAKEVFDVTGAGDTVISALAFAIVLGAKIEDAVSFSNLAAGIAVSKIGCSDVTIEEIIEKIDLNSFERKGQMLKIKDLKTLQSKGKKIVFTNGCFDILHVGHIKYLEEAKKCGDVLVIGLNSDESVKKLKGKDRPINGQQDRLKVLSNLKSVDCVMLFNEKTPLNLIKKIMPDVLVKGGDYKKEEVVGYKIVKKTRILSFIKGKSTSRLINKIKKL